jgi:hypothetical protein
MNEFEFCEEKHSVESNEMLLTGNIKIISIPILKTDENILGIVENFKIENIKFGSSFESLSKLGNFFGNFINHLNSLSDEFGDTLKREGITDDETGEIIGVNYDNFTQEEKKKLEIYLQHLEIINKLSEIFEGNLKNGDFSQVTESLKMIIQLKEFIENDFQEN